MGAIRPGCDYDYEVLMTRSHGKTHFYVWRAHTEAPFCDEQAMEYERQFVQVAVAAVVVFKVEQRVVLKVGVDGSTITETESVFVSTVVNESEVPDNSGDNDEEVAF